MGIVAFLWRAARGVEFGKIHRMIIVLVEKQSNAGGLAALQWLAIIATVLRSAEPKSVLALSG